MMQIGHSPYLKAIHDPKLLKKAVTFLSQRIMEFREKKHFDVIAFRGSSGAGMAFPLSYVTGIPVVHVRKETEKSHGNKLEGPSYNINSYIIVDDLIDSGATMVEILSQLSPEDIINAPKCLGIFLYSSNRKYSGHGDTFEWGEEKIPLYESYSE